MKGVAVPTTAPSTVTHFSGYAESGGGADATSTAKRR